MSDAISGGGLQGSEVINKTSIGIEQYPRRSDSKAADWKKAVVVRRLSMVLFLTVTVLTVFEGSFRHREESKGTKCWPSCSTYTETF